MADAFSNLAVFAALVWMIWLVWDFLKPRSQHSIRSVAILVLGDIGRSPRMMYHAQSFAEHDFTTDVIGYAGSKPIPSLERLPKVQLHYLPEHPAFLKLLPFTLLAPLKVVHQVASILYVFFVQLPNPPEFILVQNPPTIPTLAIVWFIARIRGSKVIIDWHNLGYTILALKVGDDHPFVKVAIWFERTFGRSSYAHLFVTKAMRDFLVENWDLRGHKVILHDRPPRHFHRATCQETHDLFIEYQRIISDQLLTDDFLPESLIPYSTILTHTMSSSTNAPTVPSTPEGSSLSWPSTPTSLSMSIETSTFSELSAPTLRLDRPALIVSSTSWTPDEDFGILLDALMIYEARASALAVAKDESAGRLPKLLVAVTGTGPSRDEYMAKVQELQQNWKWIRCTSLWLKAEDYPTLLGSADLGVCMHSSSSALDLPMKVVDMFGCQLPVCALDFACLNELVKDGINGLVFKDSNQLAEQLEELFKGFPHSPRLTQLRDSLVRSSRNTRSHLDLVIEDEDATWHWGTWEDNWSHHMIPLVLPRGFNT